MFTYFESSMCHLIFEYPSALWHLRWGEVEWGGGVDPYPIIPLKMMTLCMSFDHAVVAQEWFVDCLDAVVFLPLPVT